MESIFNKIYYSFTGQQLNVLRDFVPTESQIYQAEIIFTTLQRKEEYNTDFLDDKRRFISEKSVIFMAGKTRKAIVDQFFDHVFPDVYSSIYKYQCVPTFDIDNAYAFKSKGLVKNAGGMIKNILSDPKRSLARLQTWIGKSDPYDTYAYIIETCKSFGLRPLFFIQMGNYNNGFDTNINFHTAEGKKLIRFLSENGDIGIHPSFASNSNKELLKNEFNELSNIVGNKITKSRQHFLMLRFPETYRNLIELGIKEDYSMGWSSQIGFRAGTTRPFLWYDLERQEFTDLMVFPFPCMDGTLHEHMNLNPREAINHVEHFISETRSYQGVFTPLWHNHSVNNKWEWEGWQIVFEEMLALSCP